jgi:transposase
LVGEEGLPIGYDLFEGNTFEGHTLLPMLEAIQKKYGLKQPIVIADAAMLSRSNLIQLAEAKYSFIIGARIKNENNQIKQEILQKLNELKNGNAQIFERGDGTRLVVTWSKKRAQQDERNRNKGIQRLKKRVKSGRLTKESINNRGYNKFLRLEGEITVCIDEEKIKADQDWDGLKGYLTNTQLSTNQIVDNYSHLWQIEKAFRISKTDLRIRPVHHYRKRRIEAHLCISFVVYSIYKELELLLKKKNINLSPNSASTLTHTMYQMCYRLPDSKKEYTTILKMDEDQLALFNTIHES